MRRGARRMNSHSPETSAKTTKEANISRHPASAITAAPPSGASAGTIVNTIITSDMMRAICRPACRSRMIAMPTMRGPAAPMPCTTRAASSNSRLGAA